MSVLRHPGVNRLWSVDGIKKITGALEAGLIGSQEAPLTGEQGFSRIMLRMPERLLLLSYPFVRPEAHPFVLGPCASSAAAIMDECTLQALRRLVDIVVYIYEDDGPRSDVLEDARLVKAWIDSQGADPVRS